MVAKLERGLGEETSPPSGGRGSLVAKFDELRGFSSQHPLPPNEGQVSNPARLERGLGIENSPPPDETPPPPSGRGDMVMIPHIYRVGGRGLVVKPCELVRFHFKVLPPTGWGEVIFPTSFDGWKGGGAW